LPTILAALRQAQRSRCVQVSPDQVQNPQAAAGGRAGAITPSAFQKKALSGNDKKKN
jgi:hypothetical protein